MAQRALSVTDWFGRLCNGWGLGIRCECGNWSVFGSELDSIVTFHVSAQVVWSLVEKYPHWLHLSNGWGWVCAVIGACSLWVGTPSPSMDRLFHLYLWKVKILEIGKVPKLSSTILLHNLLQSRKDFFTMHQIGDIKIHVTCWTASEQNWGKLILVKFTLTLRALMAS